MILDPYGRILAETWKAADDMVVADLDASLLERATGRLWMQARRPDLYGGSPSPPGASGTRTSSSSRSRLEERRALAGTTWTSSRPATSWRCSRGTGLKGSVEGSES